MKKSAHASKHNPQCPTCGQRVPDSLLEKIVDAVMEPAHASEPPKQIATKAAEEIAKTYPILSVPSVSAIIQSAFEQMTDAIIIEQGSVIEALRASLAARASEPWTREKVHQWFGEPTVSNKVADKIVTLLNSKPAHASDWAYNYEAGYWAITKGVETINGKTFGGPLIGIAMSEQSAKDICDAHNCSRPQRYSKCDR